MGLGMLLEEKIIHQYHQVTNFETYNSALPARYTGKIMARMLRK